MNEKTWTVPAALVSYSEQIAIARSVANAAFYSGTYRERENDLVTQSKGILAELAYRHLLDSTGISYRASALVKGRGVSDADITVGLSSVDIKWFDGRVCRANKPTLDQCPAVQVVFVNIGEDRKVLGVSFSKVEVRRWPVKSSNDNRNSWYEYRIEGVK